MMTTLQQQARRGLSLAGSESGAKWAFRCVLVLSAAVYFVIGRNQWFVRDDWAFVVSRNAIRTNLGWESWLFEGQDGHWMTVPILIWRGIQNVFHLGSYWPYLIPNLVLHVAMVLLVRVLCRRVGVSAWTSTLVCALLLLFGSGWDNLVFAIQITYNLSIVCFLAQALLVDHEGPTDRRDVVGAVLGVIGVMSSGFGPIFIAGMVVLLVLRQRWKALVVAVVPQALACVWWFVFWGGDAVSARMPGPRSQVPAFVVRGVLATFEGLTGIVSLAGVALFATVALTLWRGHPWRAQSLLLTLWATVVVMFAAIGVERIGFGVISAGSSRYVHVAGVLITPAFAIAIDSLARIGREARWCGRLLVAVSIALNLGWLQIYSAQWARESRAQKEVLELTLGSGYVTQVSPDVTPVDISPNITIGWMTYLLAEQAISPRTPANEDVIQTVQIALGLVPAAP